MFDIAGYRVEGWLTLGALMIMPSIGVYILLFAAEWLLRAISEPDDAALTRKYHRRNLWLSNHPTVLAIVSFLLACIAFYVVYVNQVCGKDLSADFCP